MEKRFDLLDTDHCGRLCFKELQYGLGKLGFREYDKLAMMFQRVDANRNGVLDFAEFLALTYVFSVERGDLSCMYAYKENAKLVKDCFNLMHKVVAVYDKDGDGRLNRDEVNLYLLAMFCKPQ